MVGFEGFISSITTQPPQVRFLKDFVQPPAEHYIFRDDTLQLSAMSSSPDPQIVLRSRFLTPDGIIQNPQILFTPASDRSLSAVRQQLPEGFLLGLTLFPNASGRRRGELYATVALGRGGLAAAPTMQTLVSNYLVSGIGLGWPEGPSQQSVVGPGLIRSITGTDPAAGSEIIETVPTGARWRLLGMSFLLVTSSAAATRQVMLTLDDGSSRFSTAIAGSTQTASQTHRYSVLLGGESRITATNEQSVVHSADIILLQGFRIRTLTVSLQAGDNFGAPQLWVEEWLER